MIGCAFATLVVVVCAGLLAAAMLAHAPVVVLPLVILVGIGGPMAAALEFSRTLQLLRDVRLMRLGHGCVTPLDADALEELLAHLAALPERPHPLGL